MARQRRNESFPRPHQRIREAYPLLRGCGRALLCSPGLAMARGTNARRTRLPQTVPGQDFPPPLSPPKLNRAPPRSWGGRRAASGMQYVAHDLAVPPPPRAGPPAAPVSPIT